MHVYRIEQGLSHAHGVRSGHAYLNFILTQLQFTILGTNGRCVLLFVCKLFVEKTMSVVKSAIIRRHLNVLLPLMQHVNLLNQKTTADDE